MAETYKGLTIRIGGDATNLQKALRSTESAITRTQTQLRKMSQALRMDPGSTSAINKQLDLMGNSAVETQKKVLQLQRAIERAGGEKIELFGGKETTKTVSQLAEETSDVSRRAAEAADNYNVLNGQIESLYASINKAARASENFGKKYDIRNYRDDLESQFAKMGDLGIDDVIDDLRKLRPAWEDAFNENEIAKAIEKLRDTDSELIKTQASAKKAAETFAEMSLSAQRMSISPDIDKEIAGIRRSSEVLSDSLDRAQRALKLDPSNANAAVTAMQRLDDAANLAEQEITLLQKKISALNANGANLTARGMNNISDEARKAAEAYTEATRNLTEMRAEITRCEDGMRKLELAGKTSGDEYVDLENSVREARVEVERLEQAQAEAFNTAKRYDLASQYDEAKLRVTELTSQVESYRKAQSEITAPKSFLSSTTMMDLGMTLSTSVTPAIIGMGYAAIQSAQDIDSAYRDMRKTVNGSEDDFEALRQAAIDFSTTHVTSADQILSIQAIGGELGVAVDDLETFAQTVSNLEIATDLDADEAATSLGQLSNIMNDLSGEKMPAFSDALVRLGNNGASTESQIVDIAARIGSMSSIIGMSTPEVLAWASTIASTGQGAEAAGTAIANTMSDIEQAVAGGGDALEAFAQVSQMSAEDFARAWEVDPSSAMKAFIEGLNKIEADGGSATGTLSALGITAARQVQAIEGLMQTVGMLDDNLQMSENAWNGVSDQWGEAGDAANEAAKKAEGFSGSVQRLMNMAQVLGAEMGESLAPVIDFIADALGGLTQVFSSAPDSVKLFTAAILGLVAAAGPALMWIRAIGDTVKDIKSWSAAGKAASSAIDAIGDSAGAAGAAIGGLKGGLARLGVAVAAIGITALVSEFERVRRETEQFDKATEGLAEATENAVNIEEYASAINDVGYSAEGSVKSVTELAEAISGATDRINETNGSTATQIAQLSEAQRVINECAGKTDLTAEAQGRLEWAIGLVNEQLDLNITKSDVAADSYTNQEGQVSDLTDSIGELIEAKKREAKASAFQQNLTDLYKQQIDAQKTLKDAQEDYNEQVQWYMDNAGWSKEKAIDATNQAPEGKALQQAIELNEGLTESIREQETAYGELAQSVNESGNIYDQIAGKMDPGKFSLFNAELEASGTSFDMLKEDLESMGVGTEAFSNLTSEQLSEIADKYDGTAESIKQALADMNVSTTETRTAMVESFAQLGADVPQYLEQLGFNLDDLAGHLIMAGVSTHDLAALGVANFNALAAEAGGDINTLIALITGYNNTPIIDKNGNITAEYTTLKDANGQIYIWNGSVLKTINGEVIADSETLQPTIEEMGLYQDITLDNKTTTVSTNYGGDASPGEAAGAVDNLRARGDDTITTTVRTNYVTTYSTVTSGGTSSFGSGSGHRSAPAPSSFNAFTAAANSVPATNAVVSMLSDASSTVGALAESTRTAFAPIAARASNLAKNLPITVERTSISGSVRSLTHGMSRNPPYPGSGVRASDEARSVNVTIDGIGTTARVQSIALNLLDELERVGAI